MSMAAAEGADAQTSADGPYYTDDAFRLAKVFFLAATKLSENNEDILPQEDGEGAKLSVFSVFANLFPETVGANGTGAKNKRMRLHFNKIGYQIYGKEQSRRVPSLRAKPGNPGYGFRRARWRDTVQNADDSAHCEKILKEFGCDEKRIAEVKTHIQECRHLWDSVRRPSRPAGPGRPRRADAQPNGHTTSTKDSSDAEPKQPSHSPTMNAEPANIKREEVTLSTLPNGFVSPGLKRTREDISIGGVNQHMKRGGIMTDSLSAIREDRWTELTLPPLLLPPSCKDLSAESRTDSSKGSLQNLISHSTGLGPEPESAESDDEIVSIPALVELNEDEELPARKVARNEDEELPARKVARSRGQGAQQSKKHVVLGARAKDCGGGLNALEFLAAVAESQSLPDLKPLSLNAQTC